jgi:hypothetical protein
MKSHSEYRIKQEDVRNITRAYISVPDSEEQTQAKQPSPLRTPIWQPDDDEDGLPF